MAARDQARELAELLTADIMKARDRESHIRATARAEAAAQLVRTLQSEEDGELELKT